MLRAACFAGSLIVAALPAVAADSTRLSVQAGVGGLVKAGRWVPVRIALDHTGADLDAELVISFSTATVRRRIELAGQSSQRFESYIRAPEAANVVTAQLRTVSGVAAAAEATVTPLAQTDRVVICAAGQRFPTDACSAVVGADELPRSPRGYEVADTIAMGDSEPRLDAAQRGALQAWRSLQRLNQAGDLGLIGQPARPTLPRGLPPTLLRGLGLLTALYAGAIVAVGCARGSPRRAFRHGYVVLGVIVAAAGAAAHNIGNGVLTDRITVHHQSVVEQLPGTAAAMVTMRGIVEFPADRVFHLRWPIADAMLEPSAGAPDHAFDTAGMPEMTGRFGLGTRRAFAGEAIHTKQLLDLETSGNVLTVHNNSGITLRGCRFAGGSEPREIGEIAPGASAKATQAEPAAGPILTCSIDGMPVPLEEAGAAVTTVGTTTLAVYR